MRAIAPPVAPGTLRAYWRDSETLGPSRSEPQAGESREARFASTTQPAFIEPIECLAVTKLLDGPQWLYELKLDGYRAEAVKADGKLFLFSRRRKSFNRQYPLVIEALYNLPTNTVIDGEVVALDESGRPNFNLLQNFRTAASHIHYFVFDLLVYEGRDLTRLPLIERREIMRSVLKFRSPRIRISDYVEASATDMLSAVRQQGLNFSAIV
jgi:ATP-dependent DNA ligase